MVELTVTALALAATILIVIVATTLVRRRGGARPTAEAPAASPIYSSAYAQAEGYERRFSWTSDPINIEAMKRDFTETRLILANARARYAALAGELGEPVPDLFLSGKDLAEDFVLTSESKVQDEDFKKAVRSLSYWAKQIRALAPKLLELEERWAAREQSEF